ncbi:MAG: hypothetical protein NTX50_07020 [Candidatus Sumerlaeota bacterium]|nr:hypothetical protein [Candidatus Sumerlaeota bacterium]
MKSQKQAFLAAALMLVAACLAPSIGWGAGATIGQPPAQPAPGAPPAAPAAPPTLDDALAVFVLPNVLAFDERANQVFSKFTQGTNPNFIRKQLAETMGDATLAGLPNGAGIVVVVFSPDMFVSFCEALPAKIKDYAAAVRKNGDKSDEADGLLLISRSDACLAAGKEMAAQIKSRFLGATREPNFQANLFVKRAIAKYGAQAEAMLQSMPAMMGVGMSMAPQQPGQPKLGPEAIQKMARMLEAELRVFYSMAKQTDVVKLMLDFNGGGIQLDAKLQTLAGSNLAAFAAAPVTPAQDLLKMIPASGSIRGVVSFNAAAYADFAVKETDAVCAQMKVEKADRDALMAIVKASVTSMGDAYAFDVAPPSQGLYTGVVLSRMKDPASVLQFMETLSQSMDASGITGFYQSIGMPMKFAFTKNARDYKGTPVHLLTLDMEMKNMPPQQAAIMKKMMGDLKYNMAFAGNLMVTAVGSQPIEPILDSIKAGSAAAAKPLSAETVFGPGQQMYCDLGLGALLDVFTMAIAQSMKPGQPDPFKGVRDAFSNADPIAIALTSDKAGIYERISIPASLIPKLAQAGEAFMAAAQAPRTGSPAELNPGKPAKSAPPAGF